MSERLQPQAQRSRVRSTGSSASISGRFEGFVQWSRRKAGTSPSSQTGHATAVDFALSDEANQSTSPRTPASMQLAPAHTTISFNSQVHHRIQEVMVWRGQASNLAEAHNFPLDGLFDVGSDLSIASCSSTSKCPWRRCKLSLSNEVLDLFSWPKVTTTQAATPSNDCKVSMHAALAAMNLAATTGECFSELVSSIRVSCIEEVSELLSETAALQAVHAALQAQGGMGFEPWESKVFRGRAGLHSVASGEEVVVKSNPSERSTFESFGQRREDSMTSAIMGGQSPFSTASNDWLANGIEIGSFDLPPIPLARLPASRSGLPELKVPVVKDYQCSLPVGEFDQSNCRYEAVSLPIPPLPASFCRLPMRTLRVIRSRNVEVCRAHVAVPVAESDALEPLAIILWTAGSASSTEPQAARVPLLLAFRTQAEALSTREALLALQVASACVS